MNNRQKKKFLKNSNQINLKKRAQSANQTSIIQYEIALKTFKMSKNALKLQKFKKKKRESKLRF